MNNNRLNKLKKVFSETDVDCLVLRKNADIFYYTGYPADNDILLCTPGGKKYFLTTPLTSNMAEIVMKPLGINVLNGNVGMSLKAVINDNKIKNIGCDTFSMPATYSKLIEPSSLVDISPTLSEFRLIKDSEEIKTIKKAAKLTERIWQNIQKHFGVSLSEIEIARLIDIEIRKVSDGNSFPTISATGSNSANPHAIPTKRRFGKNDILLVDFGLKIDNYCSDLTRIRAKGRINRTLNEMMSHVAKSQEKAIKKIKSGVQIKTVSEAAYGYLRDAGYGEYILHSLGHGIGLDVHENPGIHDKNTRVLKEGMIITIEPGLYVKGLGGIRIEDMVLVTKNGCEVLTKC